MQPTMVTFLLDKSGSMMSGLNMTLESFNAYLGALKGQADAEITFSLVQFDSISTVTTWRSLPVESVGPLTTDLYKPEGGTPLIDAAVKTIRAVEAKLKEFATPPKVVVCIQTDGQENASREHTWADLNDLVKAKIADGWQFNFMGASIDAYDQGARMGIAAGSTVSYDAASPEASLAAFEAQGSNTRAFASGARGSTMYSPEQKAAAGDPDAFMADLKPRVVGVPRIVSKASPAGKKAVVDDFSL